MSLQLNKVELAGHMTRDPQCRQVNGKEVADFGLAVNRKWKTDQGELREEVTFVDITAWGRTAEVIAQYGHKGLALYVEGRLKLDQWDDKDGNKRQKLKVVADTIQFVESRRDGQGAAPAPAASAGNTSAARRGGNQPAPANDDEPPF